eukprot:TRINITY_DN9412_c0_g1_i1.p1 TRINITY_DN9412_c0_g1~~TRINITY_DN9412_c0_g1_i1.p1  ORF type:complete len:149 (+),score=41.09 TRINITY_DN9412_c0_g1_i1:129-575(+)
MQFTRNNTGRSSLDARFKQLAQQNEKSGGFFSVKGFQRGGKVARNGGRRGIFNAGRNEEQGAKFTIKKQRGTGVRRGQGKREGFNKNKKKTKAELDNELIGYMQKSEDYVKAALNADLEGYMALRDNAPKKASGIDANLDTTTQENDN